MSVLETIKVAYLEGSSEQDSEARIREFFSRDHIIPTAVDTAVASIARGLIRRYRSKPKIRPPDATHFATALRWNIPVIETTDDGFLRFDNREGDPPASVRGFSATCRSRLGRFGLVEAQCQKD